MDYELFIGDLIRPLVLKPDDVVVTITSQEGTHYNVQVLVNSEDLGRVIGRKGRIANSIRTIVHACAARNGDLVDIIIEEK